MTYSVQISPAAERQIRKLSKPIQHQITKRLLKLEIDPRPDGVKKLEGEKDLYRLRVGDSRVVYAIKAQALLVLVLKVGDRKEVYR